MIKHCCPNISVKHFSPFISPLYSIHVSRLSGYLHKINFFSVHFSVILNTRVSTRADVMAEGGADRSSSDLVEATCPHGWKSLLCVEYPGESAVGKIVKVSHQSCVGVAGYCRGCSERRESDSNLRRCGCCPKSDYNLHTYICNHSYIHSSICTYHMCTQACENLARLELRFRPEDHFCKPAVARMKTVTNIVLKVKRHKRKGSNGGTDWEYTAEVMGTVTKCFEFTGEWNMYSC